MSKGKGRPASGGREPAPKRARGNGRGNGDGDGAGSSCDNTKRKDSSASSGGDCGREKRGSWSLPAIATSDQSAYQLTRLRGEGRLSHRGRRRIGTGPGHSFIHQVAVTNDIVKKFHVSAVLRSHTGCVNAVAFDETGQLLVSGGDDLDIHTWDVRKAMAKNKPITSEGDPCHSWSSGHVSNIFGVEFVPGSGGRRVVSCGRDGRVQLCEMSTHGGVVSYNSCQLFQHESEAHRIAFDPQNNNIFFTVGTDGTCYELDLRAPPTGGSDNTGRCVETAIHVDEVRLLVAEDAKGWARGEDRDELYSATAIYGRNIFAWLAMQPPRLQEYLSVSVNPIKNTEAVIGTDRAVILIDRRMRAEWKSTTNGYFSHDQLHFAGRLTDSCYTADGKILVNACENSGNSVAGPLRGPNWFENRDATIYELDPAKISGGGYEEYPRFYHGHQNMETVKRVSTFGMQSEYILSGSDDGRMYIWDRRDKSEGPIHCAYADDSVVNCLVGHPKGYPIIATSGIDHSIKIHDCSSGPDIYEDDVHAPRPLSAQRMMLMLAFLQPDLFSLPAMFAGESDTDSEESW